MQLNLESNHIELLDDTKHADTNKWRNKIRNKINTLLGRYYGENTGIDDIDVAPIVINDLREIQGLSVNLKGPYTLQIDSQQYVFYINIFDNQNRFLGILYYTKIGEWECNAKLRYKIKDNQIIANEINTLAIKYFPDLAFDDNLI